LNTPVQVESDKSCRNKLRTTHVLVRCKAFAYVVT